MSADNTVERQSVWASSPAWGVRFWILAATLMWCAIPLSPNTVDSDFWGHVQYGEDTLTHGIAKTSTYAFTSEGYRWINHENLSEITFALLARHLGPASVLILKCLFGVVVIGLIMRNAVRHSTSTAIVTVASILVALNLSYYWGMRPQVFSFTLFAIVIAISERFLSIEKLQQLSTRSFGVLTASLSLIFFAWANSHGGFVAGVCVFNLLVACRAIAAIRNGDRTTATRGVTLIATCSLATLVNPYGIHLHLWLIESLRVPRPEVTEWHAPNLFSLDAIKTWAVIALSAVGFVGCKTQRDWTKALVFVVVLSQALLHQRHLPFVAILFGFWIPPRLHEIITQIQSPTTPATTDSKPIISSNHKTPWLAIGPIMLLCAALAYQVGTRLLAIEVPFSRYPVAALQFMEDHDVDDSIVVTGEWAQYVLAVAGARTPTDAGCRVAFDGRFRTCYPQSVVDMHFDFFRGDAPDRLRYRSPDSPPADPKRVLEFCSPNLVLMKSTEKFASGIMQESDQWSLLYKDRTAELWGRSQVYDQPASKNYLAASLRIDSTVVDSPSPVTRQPQRSALWPAAPIRAKAETAFVSKSEGEVQHD